MTKISVLGYRDLGSNVGRTITNISQGLYDRSVLEKVYPRGVVETNLPLTVIETPLPFGRYSLSLLWLISENICEFDHRVISENILDWRLSKKIKNDKADIHLYDIPRLYRSVESSKTSGKQVVIRCGGEFAQTYLERLEEEYQRWEIDQPVPDIAYKRAQVGEETLRDADKLIAISKFVEKSFVSAGIDPDKITTIPQGVDVGYFDPKNNYKTDKFSVLFMGQVGIRKGIPYLLQAWKQVDLTEGELIICGTIQDEIKPIISEFNQSNIRYPGKVDPLHYYKDASVFVFPSLSEGFAKVILEAMSTGTPVIVSKNSGGADIVEDGKEGFVIPPQDSHAIRDKIKYFADNPSEIERMGKNAREKASNYSWDRFVEELLEFLDVN